MGLEGDNSKVVKTAAYSSFEGILYSRLRVTLVKYCQESVTKAYVAKFGQQRYKQLHRQESLRRKTRKAYKLIADREATLAEVEAAQENSDEH
jgi:hypothetical protein